jgi:hypothetical protein
MPSAIQNEMDYFYDQDYEHDQDYDGQDYDDQDYDDQDYDDQDYDRETIMKKQINSRSVILSMEEKLTKNLTSFNSSNKPRIIPYNRIGLSITYTKNTKSIKKPEKIVLSSKRDKLNPWNKPIEATNSEKIVLSSKRDKLNPWNKPIEATNSEKIDKTIDWDEPDEWTVVTKIKKNKNTQDTSPKTQDTSPKTQDTSPKTQDTSQAHKNVYKFVCKNIINSGECKYGTKCKFAHTFRQVNVSECKFGNKCRHGNKCSFLHEGETKKTYLIRKPKKIGK